MILKLGVNFKYKKKSRVHTQNIRFKKNCKYVREINDPVLCFMIYKTKFKKVLEYRVGHAVNTFMYRFKILKFSIYTIF